MLPHCLWELQYACEPYHHEVFDMPLGSHLISESTAVSEAGVTGNIYELVKCEVTLQLTAAKLSVYILWELTSSVIRNTIQHWFYWPLVGH